MRSSTLPEASSLSTRAYALPALFSGYRSDIDGARMTPWSLSSASKAKILEAGQCCVAFRFRVDDLVSLYAGYFAAGGFGDKDAEPVGGSLATAHGFLAVPEGNYQDMAVLAVCENQ